MCHSDYTMDQVIDHKQTPDRNDQITNRVWCETFLYMLQELSSTWSLFTSVTRSAWS